MVRQQIVWTALFTSSVLAQSPPASNPTPVSATVARVNTRNITTAELQAATAAEIRALEEQIYAVRRRALDQLIYEELVRQESSRLSIRPDALRSHIEQSLTISDADVEAYVGTTFPAGTTERAKVLAAARRELTYREVNRRLQARVRELRAKAHIEILLPDLPPERVQVDPANDPALGPVNAPVTIVEYADFQCGYCARMNADLHEVVQEFAGKIRWVFRDFPLPNHPLAFRAAEAAECANEQGKFWAYQSELFKRQPSLAPTTFAEIADGLRLDRERFIACVGSGRYSAEVMDDLRDGRRIGVRGTPSLVVNGKLFRGAKSREQLRAIIQNELRSGS